MFARRSFPSRCGCHLAVLLSLFGLPVVLSTGHAGQQPDHQTDYDRPPTHTLLHPADVVEVDENLTLNKLVDQTLAQHPDSQWLSALEEEASAIARRGESWIAGAPQANLFFQEATSATLHYVDASIQVPLWNLGQREAEQKLANLAGAAATQQTVATRLRIAGLIRSTLWDMALQKIRYDQAWTEVKMYTTLLGNVSRRVELGDLPRADELLAETELLQKRSVMTLAEAELMHARKRYQTVTQTNKIPARFDERQVDLKEIEKNHPVLASINAQIERKRAELNTVKLEGSGPTHVAIGINSDRPSNNDPRSNNTESFNISVNMPFGGGVHLAPRLAAVNVELNRLYAERDLLYRSLEQAHHEAEHNLEVNRREVEIADNLKQVAEQHMAMMDKAFEVGEIGLMDLLKFQARTEQARLNAKERKAMLGRDQAFYNQAVGIMP